MQTWLGGYWLVQLLPSHQILEERLGTKVAVVPLCECSVDVNDLEATQLEPPPLESRDDLADEPALREFDRKRGKKKLRTAAARLRGTIHCTWTPSGLIMM